MVDTVSQIASGASSVALAENSAPLSKSAVPLDPADTKAFSVLMEDGAQGVTNPARVSSTQPGEFQQVLTKKSVELSQQVKSLEMESHDLMASNFSDPLLNMKMIGDFSFRASSTYAYLHLTSSLVSAANNSFHTLFKNQG